MFFNHDVAWQLVRYVSCYLRNGKRLVASNIIWMTGLAAQKDRPQPDRKVRGVQIRAVGRAISRDVNRTPLESVADEVARRERVLRW